MCDIITIEKKITLEPQYLDKNINSYLLEKLKELTNNECTKDYGYFLKIVKLRAIKNNVISSNSEIIFTVDFDVEVLKPDIGKTFEGNVCMIFLGGIFLNIKNKMKILIPMSSLIDYEYKQSTNQFIHKKDNKKVIKENDILKVMISGTKYSKKNFSCFGNLVE